MSQAAMIPVEQIDPSPSNPRRMRDSVQDAEMLDSVRKHGVLQPVLVRPHPRTTGRYELVFGSRRLEAARAAALDEIPATVRHLDDLEVLEIQLVENAQRADVHPLDEADAYRTLHLTHGRSVDEIAAKVGKSKATIYARLKLCELCDVGQKAFLDGKLDASTALLVARIPNEKLQADATKRIIRGYHDGPLDYRQAFDLVQREFMLRLSEAPFAKDDADLLPSAGPCTTCPKRTGNQRELFADVKGADVCTDPPCFEQKREASWKRRRAEAEAAGQVVLEGKKADGVLRGSDTIRLDDRQWEDAKSRTWRQILGKDAPPPILVRDDRGEVHEVVKRADALKVARARGLAWAQPKPAAAQRDNRTSAEATKQEIRREANRRAIAQLARDPGKVLDDTARSWRWLARGVASGAWSDTLIEIVRRRELATVKDRGWKAGAAEALDTFLATASREECMGVVLELVVGRHAYLSSTEKAEELQEACQLAGVDLATITAAVRGERARKQKEKEQKGRKKAAAKKPGKAAAKRGRRAEDAEESA